MATYSIPSSPNVATDTLWTPEVWNLELRRAAEPLYAFRQFARDVRSSYPGDDTTLYVMKTGSLSTGGGTLVAGETVPRSGFTTATVKYEPQEYGNAISLESRLLKLTPFALQETVRDLLARDAANVLDIAARTALLGAVATGVNCFNVLGGGTIIGTTKPVASGAGLLNGPQYRLSAYGVWAAVDYLNSNNAPKINRPGVGEGYIGILHPRQARGIKRDANFVSAVQYGDPDRIFNNEIGFWEGVYWIETTNGYSFTNGTTAYCAFIFGADAFGEYVIRELEFAQDPPTDFGRQQHYAWLFDGGWAVEFPEYLAAVWSLTGSPE